MAPMHYWCVPLGTGSAASPKKKHFALMAVPVTSSAADPQAFEPAAVCFRLGVFELISPDGDEEVRFGKLGAVIAIHGARVRPVVHAANCAVLQRDVLVGLVGAGPGRGERDGGVAAEGGGMLEKQ